ncbi:UNVERIFIED_ORG: creatinine amidohydrolase [Martelella mediterranea]
MAKRFYWNELTSPEFSALDPANTVAILPLASTEQHGPHLPVATDVAIAQGMLDTLQENIPDNLDVLVLPVQEIGKANEHIHGPGTLSFGADLLIPAWTTIGEKVAAAGLRKIIMVNSHGGNLDIMSIVAREMRVRFEMVAVATQWARFGTPDGMISEEERTYGIHGGEVETSLMLHFRPELVKMENAENFASLAKWQKENTRRLQPTPPNALAWVAHDLNPKGALGNAAIATAEKGAAIARHQIEGFIELVEDVVAYPLDKLYTPA